MNPGAREFFYLLLAAAGTALVIFRRPFVRACYWWQREIFRLDFGERSRRVEEVFDGLAGAILMLIAVAELLSR